MSRRSDIWLDNAGFIEVEEARGQDAAGRGTLAHGVDSGMERSGGSGFGPFGRAGARLAAARALAWVTVVVLGPAGALWSCNRAAFAAWMTATPQRDERNWTALFAAFAGGTLAAVIAWICAGVWLVWDEKRRRAERLTGPRGVCEQCGYPLEGRPPGPCPECGTPP